MKQTFSYDPAGRLDEASYPVPLIQNIKGWQGGQFPPGHAVGYSSIYSGISASSPPRTTPPGQIKKAGSEEATEGEAAFPYPVAREQWSYDDVANITGRTRDGSYESFSYEGLNRLTQAGAVGYAYNDAAEVAAKTDDSGTTRYEWNSRGELIQAKLPDGATLRYGYDAFGRMVRRELSSAAGAVPPVEERSAYIWHGLELLAEYDVSPGGSASPYKEYFYAEQVLVAVKMHGFHGRRETGTDGFLQTSGGVLYYRKRQNNHIFPGG